MNKTYKRGKIYEIIFPKEDGRVICKYKGITTDGQMGYSSQNIEESYYHDFEAISNYRRITTFWLSEEYIEQAGVIIRELKLWEIVLSSLDNSNESIGRGFSLSVFNSPTREEVRFTYD